MHFTDYLNNHSLSLLRQSERDGLYTPWGAEWDFSKPDEPVPVILRCVRCGTDLIDLFGLDLLGLDHREQMIRVLSKADIFEKFHIARIFVPVRDQENLVVFSCEDCAGEVRDAKNFERTKFANLCLWLRPYIEMGKDEKFLREGAEALENMGLDYSKLEIERLKEN